jgi:hypothetical protein
MRIFSALPVIFVFAACSSKSGSLQSRDAGLEGGAQPDSGAGGSSTGGAGGTVGLGGSRASGGSPGTGGAIASGGDSGAGGSGSGGGTGSGGAGGVGSGGAGGVNGGGAGGGSGIDASVDKPKPGMGTPCESQDDCGTTTLLFCRTPGDPYGCGTCQRAVAECSSDADCAPDGGATTKRICEIPPSSLCYCSPVKVCIVGCRTNADCGVGQGCNEAHSCEKTCAAAADGGCSLDFACSASGFCRRRACTTDSQCSAACVNGACYNTRGACQPPAA